MKGLVLQIFDDAASAWLDTSLEDDAEISIEEHSPLWGDDAGMFSYPFKLNVEANRHLFGNVDQMHGSDIYRKLYGRKFRLYVCGIPFRSGVVCLDSTVSMEDGDVEIELAAQERELSEILEGVNCRDIPVDDGVHKVQIGYSFKKDYTFPFYLGVRKYAAVYGSTGSSGGIAYSYRGSEEYEGNPVQMKISMPKAMVPRYYKNGSSEPDDFVNVQNPYEPSVPWKYPYCNIRVCTQKYVQTSQGWEKERGYCIGEPDRVNTSPCFYVPYFFYRLWATNGINVCVSENQLVDIGDYLRLAFYHTDCQYDEVPAFNGSTQYFDGDERNKVVFSVSCEKKGKFWRRYTDSVKVFGNIQVRDMEEYYFAKKGSSDEVKLEGGKWVVLNFADGNLMKAYANSDNFPDADVSTLISCIKNTFCARLLFDSSGRSLRVVLMRNILGSRDVNILNGYVSEMYTEHSRTCGFRLKYKSSQEIYKNRITGRRVIIGTDEDKNGSGVDTTYNYNDYRKLSSVDEYSDIVGKVNPYDFTTYMNTVTGNAYRIKVDENASTEEELFPSLFEVGGYGDVEIGDCENDDCTEEVSLDFVPVIPNDVNYEKQATSDSDDAEKDLIPKYAQYVDAEVHHVTKNDADVMTSTEETFDMTLLRVDSYADNESVLTGFSQRTKNNFKVCLHVKMDAVESYDISGGAEPPYDKDTSGIVLGIMRGSGADAEYIKVGDDGEGNYEWSYVPGSSSAFTSDSIDYNGNTFDYNGASKGAGGVYLGSGSYDAAAASAIIKLNASFSQSITFSRDLLYTGDQIRATYINTLYKKDRVYVCPVRTVRNLIANTFYLVFYPGEYEGRLSEYMAIISQAERASTNEQTQEILGSLYIATYTTPSAAYEAMVNWVNISDIGDVRAERLSLKLKAEKKNPYHGASESSPKYGKTEDPYKELTDDEGYFRVTGDIAQRRGLYDQFYADYADWVINRKVAHIKMRAELADLINIDYSKRYRIGDVVGFINKISYTVSADGVGEANIEMYYL